MDTWRFVDTGPRSAAENVALDEVLLRHRACGASPNTIRLLEFSPRAVLVGFHQSVEQEVRLSYCRENNVDVNRRITGGGAIFCDETQIGWEIICGRSFLDMGIANEHLFGRCSAPVVHALKTLGISAAFRPRNDIEVHGRKISGTGGTEEGGAFLFQGTLLVDFDVGAMLRALRVPVEKLKDKEISSAGERVTWLKKELGHVPGRDELKEILKNSFQECLGIHLEDGELTGEETAMLCERMEAFRSRDWVDMIKSPRHEQRIVHSVHKASGGIIRTAAAINLRRRRIQSVLITGDFFAYPRRAVLDLEAALKDVRADVKTVDRTISSFMEEKDHTFPGLAASDFVNGIAICLEKADITRHGIPLRLADRITTVNSTFHEVVGSEPKHLLLPYCAKLPDCVWRYETGCGECGGCSIGDAYAVGRERGMEVTTIQSFEDLMETLGRLKAQGVRSYIGCCCEPFFMKHREDFERTGLPAILMDIDDTTCYDLGKEQDAYAGRFEGRTDVNMDLMRRVLDVRI